VSSVNALLDGLSPGEHGKESTDESVSCSVGVYERLGGERDDSVLGNLAVLSDNGGLRSLGEDDDAGAGAVDLGHGADLEGDLSEVLALVAEAMLLSVCLGLGLVAENVVGVWEGCGDLVGKEVNDEGGGEVEAEDLVGLGSVLSDGEEGLYRDGEEESSGVVDLGGGDDLRVRARGGAKRRAKGC